jgi:hypothetical protein
MDMSVDNYLLDDFNNNINLNTNQNIHLNIIYPIIKIKNIKIIINSLCNDSEIKIQIRTGFLKFICNNNNIFKILTNTFSIIKSNKKIIINDKFISQLKSQYDQKNLLFKYSYFCKIFNGVTLCNLYFYHNCFIIYLFFCNELRKSLNLTVFDEIIANSALQLLISINSNFIFNNTNLNIVDI